MIRDMPAAAPDNAPRPPLASWLIAGVVVVAALALTGAVLWFILPTVRPALVLYPRLKAMGLGDQFPCWYGSVPV